MDLITKLRYQGYLATPPLWNESAISKYNQVELDLNSVIDDTPVIFKNKRLGKLVEEFVFYRLKQETEVEWICDNLQIQDGKQTVGEIDALYYDEAQPIHLEIVYKFYLYDTLENYKDPLSYWIGPNRKDSLLYKLNKLHNKQLPLLHHKSTKIYLDAYKLEAKNIARKLCFKAQLFLPYMYTSVDLSLLNSECIAGFYISFSKISALQYFEFYIPKKLDWLIIPHQDVNWMPYNMAIEKIEKEIITKHSPLVWIKTIDHKKLQKCFITYW